jgi:hypothetical protein
MEVDESGDQEMPSEVEMRVVTQDTPNHQAPRGSRALMNQTNRRKRKKFEQIKTTTTMDKKLLNTLTNL